MRLWCFLIGGVVRACAVAAVAGFPSPAAVAQTVAEDGVTVKISGRSMRCGQTPVYMDDEIPTEGMSVPGEGLYLNPFLLKRQPAAVRLFIFKHECAHEVTGPDELGADCIAAKSGARDGWLKVGDIDAVCRSFAGPATKTHPSGDTRCANIRRCFAGTQVASSPQASGQTAKASSWSAAETADGGVPENPAQSFYDAGDAGPDGE